MPIRRFNFTGRQRIFQRDAPISLRGENGSYRFEVKFDLQKYSLPPNGLVFVEAYRQTSWKRFRFGTVGEIHAWDEPLLAEFGTCEGVLFRIRVTSAFAPRGRLLAEADQIRPRRPDRQDDARFPLLPARPDESLDAEVYRVSFDDVPMLLINSRLGDWQGLTQNTTFQSLALPAILREILTRVLHIEHYVELDDPDDWRSLWLRFAKRLPGVSDVPKQDETDRFDDWIDEAVASFSRKFQTLDRFGRYWSGESES